MTSIDKTQDEMSKLIKELESRSLPDAKSGWFDTRNAFARAVVVLKACQAENARLQGLLEWLDRRGGLGLRTHERIRAALAEPGS